MNEATYIRKWFLLINYILIDINECSNVEDNNCHKNAICTNTNGSFICQCQNGYTGNGTTCTGKWLDVSIIKEVLLLVINKCSNAEYNNCHKNAICTNTNGSFVCQCQNGYTGNGTSCNGKWFDHFIVKEVITFH